MEERKRALIMGLCAGGKELSFTHDGYIYEKDTALDCDTLYDTCHNALKKCHTLFLYVTIESTLMLSTVIDYCIWQDVTLILNHYNKETGKYEGQPMARMPQEVMEKYKLYWRNK